jgi:seryl-tRNA synthetase
VHALNCTLCATERALCCVLENYQDENGIHIPEVLQKYLPGQPKFLEYTKDAPKRQAPGGASKADGVVKNNQTKLPDRTAAK